MKTAKSFTGTCTTGAWTVGGTPDRGGWICLVTSDEKGASGNVSLVMDVATVNRFILDLQKARGQATE